jgi:hypothetical protein
MSAIETIPTQTNKEAAINTNGFSMNGLHTIDTPTMTLEEFQKMSTEEKASYLDNNSGEGPELTIEEIVQIIKEGRRNGE